MPPQQHTPAAGRGAGHHGSLQAAGFPGRNPAVPALRPPALPHAARQPVAPPGPAVRPPQPLPPSSGIPIISSLTPPLTAQAMHRQMTSPRRPAPQPQPAAQPPGFPVTGRPVGFAGPVQMPTTARPQQRGPSPAPPVVLPVQPGLPHDGVQTQASLQPPPAARTALRFGPSGSAPMPTWGAPDATTAAFLGAGHAAVPGAPAGVAAAPVPAPVPATPALPTAPAQPASGTEPDQVSTSCQGADFVQRRGAACPYEVAFCAECCHCIAVYSPPES